VLAALFAVACSHHAVPRQSIVAPRIEAARRCSSLRRSIRRRRSQARCVTRSGFVEPTRTDVEVIAGAVEAARARADLPRGGAVMRAERFDRRAATADADIQRRRRRAAIGGRRSAAPRARVSNAVVTLSGTVSIPGRRRARAVVQTSSAFEGVVGSRCWCLAMLVERIELAVRTDRGIDGSRTGRPTTIREAARITADR
jgi:hypothetical protein